MINKTKFVYVCFIVSLLIICSLTYFVSSSSLSYTKLWEEGDDPKLSIEFNYTDEIPYGITLIGANKVWNQTSGSPEIVVAVLDTGLDANHSDLVNALWNNTNEIPDNGIDDDNNDYIDDCHGWDFVHNNSDPFNLSIYSSDLKKHGTHVTGTIAARLNNYGVVGVAPNVSIMTLRVVNENNLNPDILVAEAIRYAADNGAHIISMSIGIYDEEITNSTSYQLVEAALQHAYSEGVLIVASAGNDNPDPVTRPANNPNVIAVGAINSAKNIASFSCRGPEVELVAPGVGIYSTIPNNDFALLQGTSMAAPHVAGALALIISYDPTLNNTEARMILQQTAEDLGTSDRDEVYGFGLINLTRAIETIDEMNSTSTFSSTSSETTTISSSASDTVTTFTTTSETTNTSIMASKTTTMNGFSFYIIVLLVLPLGIVYRHRRKRNQ